MQQIYKTKVKKLSGTDFKEVRAQAFVCYQKVKKRTRRRPYIRSAYFNKDKVFIDLFWQHLFDAKNWRDRIRRMKYFPAAIELLKNSKLVPKTKENPNKRFELLHRFAGMTPDNHFFVVQVKEDKRKSQKFLISVFPRKE